MSDLLTIRTAGSTWRGPCACGSKPKRRRVPRWRPTQPRLQGPRALRPPGGPEALLARLAAAATPVPLSMDPLAPQTAGEGAGLGRLRPVLAALGAVERVTVVPGRAIEITMRGRELVRLEAPLAGEVLEELTSRFAEGDGAALLGAGRLLFLPGSAGKVAGAVIRFPCAAPGVAEPLRDLLEAGRNVLVAVRSDQRSWACRATRPGFSRNRRSDRGGRRPLRRRGPGARSAAPQVGTVGR